MTQEEKELLLKDICARLSHGITIYRITDNSTHRIQYSDITENIDQFSHLLEYSGIDNIKPYLRPMSSMTEKEKLQLIHYAIIGDGHIAGVDFVDWVERKNVPSYTDWINAHHFDYRGLIPMGLALEASEDMYKQS